ncbi:MAG: hypothetical protein G01um101448_73 [Parcubacteria group bacterium Gr01-1014_48]|nr:MAG: hypothetical protein Greene041614_155 [Parcubacteria group bacterium Greene0416_14]TSC74554.1 MAG: hypothetical protein G01um101448_73 [Parcubacteria group bacterium Gr01-1014_48]TSD01430.1 MAG: hypothetical protein Greene101415_277 [Parcubacteria group bacterium Greene1014_15]TSD08428.1 MAG: hypothetical protein Greene07144_58 [Parcubacteria group bacterium Greene0714_4]
MIGHKCHTHVQTKDEFTDEHECESVPKTEHKTPQQHVCGETEHTEHKLSKQVLVLSILEQVFYAGGTNTDAREAHNR